MSSKVMLDCEVAKLETLLAAFYALTAFRSECRITSVTLAAFVAVKAQSSLLFIYLFSSPRLAPPPFLPLFPPPCSLPHPLCPLKFPGDFIFPFQIGLRLNLPCLMSLCAVPQFRSRRKTRHYRQYCGLSKIIFVKEIVFFPPSHRNYFSFFARLTLQHLSPPPAW